MAGADDGAPVDLKAPLVHHSAAPNSDVTITAVRAHDTTLKRLRPMVWIRLLMA